tara:strand:+ start:247 stop:522 length:276 start_codon:yes stop_codon:yes gene_type:complete
MIVNTPHGEFEVNDITRKERRKYYGRVKEVYASNDPKEIHELTDDFILVAFGSEEEADKKLKGLSALEEDEVFTAIILAYMGLSSGNSTGD